MFKSKTVLQLVCIIAGLNEILCYMSTINGTFGSPVTLDCNIALNETADEVIWDSLTKNGNVTFTPHISGISGSIPQNPALTILVASILDSGIYTCKIRIYNKTIQSNATALMIHGAKPDVQIKSSLVSGTYGVSTTLYVEIDATPPSFHIYWTKQNDHGEIIIINSRSTGYEGGNISDPSLTLSNPRFTDKGLYTCYARNDLGLGYSYKIHVDVKGDVPKVSVDSLSYEVPFGSPVQINCTVTSFPNHIKIFWHRNRNDVITTITPDTEGVTGSTNDMPVLRIKFVTTHDAGSYTCFAENSVGVGGSRSILLSVIGGRPLVEVNRSSYSTVYGTAVTLRCEINSDPPLVAVYWKKITSRGFGSTISSGTVGMQGINLTHPSLTIEFPVTSDAGEYICFAVNAIGSSGSLPTLLKVFGAKPVVTVSSGSFLANYGNEHTLLCNVASSLDNIEVIWEFRQNEVVRTITFETSGIRGVTKDNPSLTINFVTLSDDGIYTCCATSIIGTGKSRSVRLSVDAALPYVSVVLPIYSVIEGNGISLACKVISSPRHTHVYWHKEKNNFVSILKEGTTGILGVNIHDPSITFNPARKGDSGEYTCFAINVIGVGFSRTVSLEVVTISEESNKETIVIKEDNCNSDILYGVIASVGTIAAVVMAILAILTYKYRRLESTQEKAGNTSTSGADNAVLTEMQNETHINESQTVAGSDIKNISIKNRTENTSGDDSVGPTLMRKDSHSNEVETLGDPAEIQPAEENVCVRAAQRCSKLIPSIPAMIPPFYEDHIREKSKKKKRKRPNKEY